MIEEIFMKNPVKSRCLLITALVSILFVPWIATAQGVPAKNPKCAQGVRVHPPANASGVFFDESCQTAYVLPPIEGQMSLASLAPTSLLGECGAMELRYSTLEQLSRRMDALWKQLNGENISNHAPRSGGAGAGGTIGDGATLSSNSPGNGPSGSDVELVSEPVVEPGLSVDEVMALTEKLDQTYRRLRTVLQDYSKIGAATAQLNYKINMPELVDAYQSLNPGLRFERMLLEVARLAFVSKAAPEQAELSGAISVNIPTIGELPVGGEPLSSQGARVDRPSMDTGVKAPIFGDALSGQIVLSLPGACPFYDKETQWMRSSVSARELGSYFSANVQYSYHLQAFREYTARYQLANLVRRIKSESSSGGFFRTNSATRIINENDSKSWFILEANANDERFNYGDLAVELKADLMDRVLKQVAQAQVGQMTSVSDPAAPRENGASSAAKGLRSNCAHYYCQAGAAVLDVLNASLGGVDTTAVFIANNDHWAVDTVKEKRMFRFYGSFSFTDAKAH